MLLTHLDIVPTGIGIQSCLDFSIIHSALIINTNFGFHYLKFLKFFFFFTTFPLRNFFNQFSNLVYGLLLFFFFSLLLFQGAFPYSFYKWKNFVIWVLIFLYLIYIILYILIIILTSRNFKFGYMATDGNLFIFIISFGFLELLVGFEISHVVWSWVTLLIIIIIIIIILVGILVTILIVFNFILLILYFLNIYFYREANTISNSYFSRLK